MGIWERRNRRSYASSPVESLATSVGGGGGTESFGGWGLSSSTKDGGANEYIAGGAKLSFWRY